MKSPILLFAVWLLLIHITYMEYFGPTTLVVTNGAHSAAWLPTDCCSSSSLAKRGVGEGQKARWPSFATSYYWHRSVIYFHRFIHDNPESLIKTAYRLAYQGVSDGQKVGWPLFAIYS